MATMKGEAMDRPKPDRILVVARDAVHPPGEAAMRHLMRMIEVDGPEKALGCGFPVDLYQRIDGVWEHVWSGPESTAADAAAADPSLLAEGGAPVEHIQFTEDRLAFKFVQDPATGEMVRLDDGKGNIVRDDPWRSRDDGMPPGTIEIMDGLFERWDHAGPGEIPAGRPVPEWSDEPWPPADPPKTWRQLPPQL